MHSLPAVIPMDEQRPGRLCAPGTSGVAVNLDKEPQLAERFLEVNPAAFRIVYDPKGAIASSYDVKAMPSSVIIGRDGHVRAVHRGFHEDEEEQYVSDIKGALSANSIQKMDQ